MKYIEFHKDYGLRGVPFWFAVEEYVARHWTDDDYFLIWQVAPCVMVGRNQLIDNEVNVEYCRQHHIAITRRKSGGGCIYSDEGCLLFSYIVREHDAAVVFERRMQDTARTLRAAGLEVELSGRNDILVQGRKVAGAAFYRCGTSNVMHNSLLFSSNFDHMQRAITPSKAKLQSKGVESVSQRVGNVGDYTSMDIASFRVLARRTLCSNAARVLTEEDMTQVLQIEQQLASDEFIFGSNPKYSVVRKARIDGVGTLEARIELRNDVVRALNFTGDFFLLGDIDGELIARLKGVKFSREAVGAVLMDVPVGRIVRGLTASELLDLLFGAVRKPSWLKSKYSTDQDFLSTQRLIRDQGLHTICQSGRCPNRAECWRNSTATFMIGGDVCTRHCRFCNTRTGRPAPLDADEPARVAESIRSMQLRYAVITSVDRDDLPDGGANHWAATIRKVHEMCAGTRVEVLIPDFGGDTSLLDIVLHEHPDVVGHNMETTRSLTPYVRSVATYDRSLGVLSYVEQQGYASKTGFMVGLGETEEEIHELLRDIHSTGCRRLTIGQYLQPTHAHLPVMKYYTPDEFAQMRRDALALGFEHVVSGPLVRSSYHADQS
ncbi:MAG: lipoyl synthase [Bacteroidales bacterium]|nr:lipoyl synthase [Bacteroidales bacterium]